MIDRGVDYVFLPLFRDMPTLEKVRACTCPLTQGLPFYARHAFGLGDDRMLRPLLSFGEGLAESRGSFVGMAERLGFSREEGLRA